MLNAIKSILHDLHAHNITIEDAYHQLKAKPFEDIGYAKIDLHRQIRKGASEVIYGAGKTPEQIAGIIEVMKSHGQSSILITRLNSDNAQKLKLMCSDITYYPDARIAIYGAMHEPDTDGYILIATGGTSDIPIAEESSLTAEFLGNKVKRLYDVGVAGLHRVLSHIDDIMSANVIVAVAGMEGALASVIGGLADCPVIAVPTSVGYGASFGGVSALLAMLNSCASGVSVVNIDNGFGAGYLASMINHIGGTRP